MKNRRAACVPTGRHEHVDDLPVLVDGAVYVPPHAVDPHIGFVDEPAITGRMPYEPSRVDQQRCEPLYPSVDGDVIDGDATLGQQFLDVAEGQAIPQVPAHGQHDHVGRKPEACES